MHPPQTLLEGKYEILNKMREGGMGTIYRVRHRLLDQIRVIKVMRAHVLADSDLKQRFLEEAKTATRLEHPNICTIHDFALDEEGTAYLVMQFIEGVNLSEFLALQSSPGLPLSLEIAHQALLALGYLHRKNVIHRDVAPDNLMLTQDEEGRPLVKLIDLGIAKVADRPTAMTGTGVFLGKLRYASPEAFGTLRPGEKLDGRSDLYSLGVVLYELLTHVRPFAGDSPGELLRGHLSAAPLPFSESDREGRVPADLRAAILKALEKRREDRYSSAEEFDREILSLQSRHSQPEDLGRAQQMLSTIPRIELVTGKSVTPSAQDRLDRQFAHSTPRPSDDLLTSVNPNPEAQQTIPTPPRESAAPAPEVPAHPAKRPARSLIPWIVGIAVAIGVALMLQRRAGRLGESAQGMASAPTALPAPSPNTSEPAAAPALSVSPEPEATIAPALSPPPESGAAPPLDLRARRATEASRAASLTARRIAEGAHAPALATETYLRARDKETEAHRLFAEGQILAAKAVFDGAARLYAQSAAGARAAAVAPPPVAVAVIPPTPAPRVEPTRPAISTPERDALPAAVPSPPARAGASEQDRIRETVRNYEQAQNTLDADLYTRVFPSVDRNRIARAFESFKSQSVDFEVRRIQLDASSTHAEVFGYEKRVAVPRAGTEQHIEAERVLRLEKRGDSWVITQVK